MAQPPANPTTEQPPAAVGGNTAAPKSRLERVREVVKDLREFLFKSDDVYSLLAWMIPFLVFCALGVFFFAETNYYEHMHGKRKKNVKALLVCSVLVEAMIAVWASCMRGYFRPFSLCCEFNPVPKFTKGLRFFKEILRYVGYVLSLACSVFLVFGDEHKVAAILCTGFYAVGLSAIKLARLNSDQGILGTAVGVFMSVGFTVLNHKKENKWKVFIVLVCGAFLLWLNDFLVPVRVPEPQQGGVQGHDQVREQV